MTCLAVVFWPMIYKHMSPEFQSKYSSKTPPLDKTGHLSFQTVQDFVEAQQILLNQCVRSRTESSDPSEYDAGFGVNISILGNTITDSSTAVSFYRQRSSAIVQNWLHSTSANKLGMYGVLLDNSHHSKVQDNYIGGWQDGVVVRGRPMSLSRLGGSLNQVGSPGNHVDRCHVGIQFATAGFDNSVRENVIKGYLAEACDFSGGKRFNCTANLTTDNIPWQCNTGYMNVI